jgi:methionyl-tRNA synthetase
MAAELPPPKRCAIHGYLLMDEHKMSKSLGNVLDPFRIVELYGKDALRYYVLREVSFGQDGSVSTEGFERRYTSELANEYGNLASRTLAMIAKYRDGVVPDAEVAPELAKAFAEVPEQVAKHFDEVELSAALDEIWGVVRQLNAYVQEQEPWKLAKDEAEKDRLDQVLHSLTEGLRVVSTLLLPFIPEAAAKLLEAVDGETVGELEPLFPRVEVEA